MSETAANRETGPAMTPDSIVNMLVREQEAADTTADTAATADATAEATASETPDPEPQTEEPKPEPKYTVKVRGQEVEVTLDELRNGYSRTEDYRAKTAEVAREREAAQRQTAEIAARAQQLDALLERAEFDPVLVAGSRTDWDTLAREKPAEYVQQKQAFDSRIQYWQQVAHHRAQAKAQAAQAALEQGERRLREVMPDWADDAKRETLKANISRTLKEHGFREDEFSGVTDPRILTVVHEAALYRQMQAERKAAEAKKAAPVVPKVMPPGTTQPNRSNAKVQALLKNAAKSGRVDDQVNAIMAALE